MTVEAYLRSLVPGLDLPIEVYQRAARSPKEVGLEPVDLDADIDAIDDADAEAGADEPTDSGNADKDAGDEPADVGEPAESGDEPTDGEPESDGEPEPDGDEPTEPVIDAATLFQMRLDYASSTVYYAVLGVFAGGGYTEEHGDVQVRKGGYTITMADRERFKMLADALRRKWGFPTEDDSLDTGGMFDGGYLRRGRPCRRKRVLE